uniref:Methyltransferase like 7A n=1 Tax=Pipistrellus kuhlii TaxID=59472 RepID=A0A7J7ZLH5_PIPKU|nr:methyltransferase like 7A [Pipistrellus kuhlii]
MKTKLRMAPTVLLLQLAVRVLALPLYLLDFLGVWSWICKRCFPFFLARFSSVYNRQMASTKRGLFGSLQEHAGPSGALCLLESIAENRHVQFERFVVAAGEDMRPVADGSVDAVVCTLVLCSVQNQERILQEVRRVLRPGGAFYFLEHVAAERSTWSHFWQQVLEPVWYLVFDGCSLTRESWKTVERAGFSKLQLQRLQAPLSWPLVRPHICGYAVK